MPECQKTALEKQFLVRSITIEKFEGKLDEILCESIETKRKRLGRQELFNKTGVGSSALEG